MDRASGWQSRKDCSLRKASCEHLYAVFSKRGASGRHNKLVRKIPDAFSIPKEVKEMPMRKSEAEWKSNFIEGAGRLRTIGCDFHSRFQQIAMLDDQTGEIVERRRFSIWIRLNRPARLIVSNPVALSSIPDPTTGSPRQGRSPCGTRVLC